MVQKDQVVKVYPLSPMQSGMLFHSMLENQPEAYFVQTNMSLLGRIDLSILEKSLKVLTERHEVFRTFFSHKKLSQPLQAVLKERAPILIYEDITEMQETKKCDYVEAFKKADRKKGFDLTKDVLFRIAVLKTGEEQYEMIWSMHHIVLDGWSSGILRAEFFKIYEEMRNDRPLQLPPAYPYSDYINWLEKQDKEEALEYWSQYLEDYSDRSEIPNGNRIQGEKAYELNEITHFFEEAHTEQLNMLCRRHNLTLNSLMQTVWGVLLQQYNDNDDVVYGMVVSGRQSEVLGIERMVGLFVNTIPVRIRRAGHDTFLALMKQVQADLLKSERYDYVSLADIQARSALKSNLFDHICVFQNYPMDAPPVYDKHSVVQDFVVTALTGIEQTSFGLNVIMGLSGNRLFVKLSYNVEAYQEESMKQLIRHLAAMVEQVAARPEMRLDEIELAGEEEKRQLLTMFNDTKADYPKDQTI
ncbi:condensation domain-containing protein, partial [Paenibacillus solani]